jgi:hypothetical protein
LERALAELGHERVFVEFQKLTATAVSARSRFPQADAVLVRSIPAGTLEQTVFRMNVLHRLEAEGLRIVNPPAAKKYHYWTNDALPESAEKWFEGATQRPGSWWEDWQAWIEKTGADKVPARIPQKAIEPAPGRYAKLRLSTKSSS